MPVAQSVSTPQSAPLEPVQVPTCPGFLQEAPLAHDEDEQQTPSTQLLPLTHGTPPAVQGLPLVNAEKHDPPMQCPPAAQSPSPAQVFPQLAPLQAKAPHEAVVETQVPPPALQA